MFSFATASYLWWFAELSSYLGFLQNVTGAIFSQSESTVSWFMDLLFPRCFSANSKNACL